MRVLVTGAAGKVGKHVYAALLADPAVTAIFLTDLARGVYDTPLAGDVLSAAGYTQADLLDAGSVYSLIVSCKPDAVIHVAAIPDPSHTPPHVVFSNNVNSTFNVVEACVRLGVPRLVNMSSECVPGAFFPERVTASSGRFAYCPVDEAIPVAPQDPYGLSKLVGEQICDAAVRRSDMAIVSIRPSWCQDAHNIARNLGPLLRDASLTQPGFWSYIVISDLAAACVAAAKLGPAALPGHEVVYIAADDNIGNRDLAAAMAAAPAFRDIPVRALARKDASGINNSKAKRLLGWAPKKSWSDFLTPTGELKPTA